MGKWRLQALLLLIYTGYKEEIQVTSRKTKQSYWMFYCGVGQLRIEKIIMDLSVKMCNVVLQSSTLLSSVTQSCPTLFDSMDCSTTGSPVHHQFSELTQTHVHQVCDAIQPSPPLSSPSPPAFNLSQHQGLFRWVSSLHQVAKVLEFQFQHQSFQWIFRTDFL